MLYGAVNQGLYDPITELREQLGRGREKGHRACLRECGLYLFRRL